MISRFEPLIFLGCIWLAVWANSCPALANTPLSLEAKTWAARACFAEASFRHDDCTEILWVVTRRSGASAGPSWLGMLRRYCAGMREGLRTPTPRQAEIRGYPWGDVPGKSVRFNRQWAELRQHVTEWAEGKHPSKCKATHWGSPVLDKPKGGMVRVDCMGTANSFYVVKR